MNLSAPESALQSSGFSLLEVVVALGVIGVALAALAPILVQCTMMLHETQDETRALVLATSRLEELSMLPYAQRADTLALVTDRTTNLASMPATLTGPGLRLGPPTATWADTAGYVDWIADNGEWEPSRMAASTFVRRWSVIAFPGVGGDSPLLLQVFARGRAREDREPARVASRARRIADVWLFSARFRILR